jgi:hypothetical protein
MGPQPRTLAEQFFDVQRRFARVQLTRTGMRFPLRPSALSPVYYIRIDYAPHMTPKVYVERPSLVPGVPHRYDPGGNLCLYEFGYNNTMGMGETIVPWTAQWLGCYEWWQVTREWPAPESSHRGPK